MSHLFVTGQFYITGEQIHRQSRWCAAEFEGSAEHIAADQPGAPLTDVT